MVGTNDVTHLTPLRRLAADTERLFDELARWGAPVLASSLPEFRAMTAMPVTVRSAVTVRARAAQRVQSAAAAARPEVDLVDVRAAVGAYFRADPSTVSRDLFHPSAQGYQLIADALEGQLIAAVRQHLDPVNEAGPSTALSSLQPADGAVTGTAHYGHRSGRTDAAATVVARSHRRCGGF